jgi:hypothetical protein
MAFVANLLHLGNYIIMETDFSFLASARSNQELIERIENRQKYMPETVEASLAELQSRGHEFSDEEVKVIREDIQAHRANAAIVSGNLSMFNDEYKNAIVEDPDAPQMYSRRVLYFFTVFFSALFGSIMLSLNARKLGKNSEAAYILIFGVVFTLVQVWIGIHFHPNSKDTYGIIGGLIGAYCLDYFFWKRYIGYGTFYRTRSFVMPLVIGVAIVAVVLVATFYGGGKAA